MNKIELLKAQEILKEQLVESRTKFTKIEKAREQLWEQYRNATSEKDRERLEKVNKDLDKEYYELSNANHQLPTMLSSLENMITGKYVSPFDF